MDNLKIGTAAKDLTEADLHRIAAAHQLGVMRQFENTGVWQAEPTPYEAALFDRLVKQVEENKQRNTEKDVEE